MVQEHQHDTPAEPSATSSGRSLAARIAAHERWAAENDRTAATAPARQGLRARFAREVDPHGTMPAADLEARVDQMHKAHMLRMSLAAKKARAKRRQA